MGQKILPACCLLIALVSGCTTTSQPPTVTPVIQLAPPAPVGHATIKGSQESSMLLDNFTAFITAVDGQPVTVGRKGWNVPLEIKAGHRRLTVEFIRGVFTAQAELQLEAVADLTYQLKYTTDAELFGHNSYCDFWIVETGSGKILGPVTKAAVIKR